MEKSWSLLTLWTAQSINGEGREDQELIDAVQTLVAAGLGSFVGESVWEASERHLLVKLMPQAWQHIEEGLFVEAVRGLARGAHSARLALSRIDKMAGSAVSSRLNPLTQGMLSLAPSSLRSAATKYFSDSFQESNDEFKSCCAALSMLRWGPLVETIVMNVLTTELGERVSHCCEDGFAARSLPAVLDWLSSSAMPWTFTVLSDQDQSVHEAWAARLSFHAHQSVGLALIDRLFDIIVDFPDSTPSLHDLRDCLSVTSQQQVLVSSLKSVFSKRLLIPGAATSDIITQYVATIKTLRLLDPSGVTMEAVSGPIQAYLRGREDTIRCIVESLTEEGELADELSVPEQKHDLDGLSDHGDAGDWDPDPWEADPSQDSKARRAADILSLLVAIFGSKDLFVSEYRTTLAERLIAERHYEIDRDVQNVELFKLRFGEAALANCEVMLGDISDSKRINQRLQEDLKREEIDAFSTVPFSSTIVSRLFWPPFRDEANIKLPQGLQQQLDAYGVQYNKLKAPRKLIWMPQLGSVDLNLHMADGRCVNVVVPLVQAAIISLFETRGSWTVSDLAAELDMPVDRLGKRLQWWVGQGVMRSDASGLFTLVETGGEPIAPVDSEAGIATMDEQAEDEMKVYESFVMGMLTNFDELTLDRIHNMLKMFVLDPPFTKTVAELGQFLGDLVRAGQLELKGGSYSKVG